MAWGVIVTALNLGLRHGWPAYAAVEKAMAFTPPMMIARLSESAVASLVSGWIAARIGGQVCALVAGLMLLLVFAQWHIPHWQLFPAWYHLTFLSSLVIVSVIGGKLARASV